MSATNNMARRSATITRNYESDREQDAHSVGRSGNSRRGYQIGQMTRETRQ